MNINKLMEKAKALQIDPIEVYIQKSEKQSIEVFAQKVDALTIAQSGGMAIRGIYNGKMGYCFVEEDSDDNIDTCLQMLMENAKALELDEPSFIYAGDNEYPSVEVTENQLVNVDASEKIAYLKEVESKLAQSDPRIVQVMGSLMETQQVQTQIYNSLGMDLHKHESYTVFYSSVLAQENNDNKSAYEIKVMHSFDECPIDAYVEKLKEKVCSKLNATQVKTGKYKVILKNNAMSSLLGAFTGLFDGEQVYKGISKLKDKMNETIFDEKITILDDPLKKDGINSTPFDDEGVASYTKTVVENGVLKLFLHNQKSAAQMNTISTGNGFKSGYASSVGIHPTNFYIQPSDVSFDALVEQMDCGLIIDEINGLHAGLNPITTDFSLQAAGYYVENGKIVKPVNLITVAGNFLEMMKEVEVVGSDLEDALSSASAPSILFTSLSISGE